MEKKNDHRGKCDNPEDRLRNIVDGTPFAIAITDLKNSRIIFWNETAIQLFGYTPENIRDWYDTAYPDEEYQKEVIERWKRYLKIAENNGKTVNTGEYNVTCADGSVKICEIHVKFLEDCLVITLNDVSNQKQIEKELIESKQRFELAVNATRDGIFDWDLIKDEMYFSPGWKSMLGYEYDELENSIDTWKKLTHEEDAKKAWIAFESLLKNESEYYEVEFRMKHKDGRWIYVLARATAIFNDEGVAIRVTGTHVDITKMKKIEKSQAERLNELEIFNEAAVDREIIINDLRKEINILLSRLEEAKKYEIVT